MLVCGVSIRFDGGKESYIILGRRRVGRWTGQMVNPARPGVNYACSRPSACVLAIDAADRTGGSIVRAGVAPRNWSNALGNSCSRAYSTVCMVSLLCSSRTTLCDRVTEDLRRR